jgi:rhodanese-related sulfurtransferase
MFFRQGLHEDLGCASYVIADAGEAVVIDPKWEIEETSRSPTSTASRSGTSSRHTTTPTTSPGTAACARRPAAPFTFRRTPASTIAGAVDVPLGELEDRHAELPRDARLIAVCRSGNRSARAVSILRRHALDAENLEGGMKGWKSAGLRIEPHEGFLA